jgi:hypothetical protein
MLSKKQLRSDIEAVELALKKRNFSFDIKKLTDLENKRKKIRLRHKSYKICVILNQKLLVKPRQQAKILSHY